MLIGGRLGNLVLNLVALAAVGVHLFYVARGLRSLAGIAVDFTNYYLAAQLVVTGEDFYVNLGHVGQRFGIADVWLPYTLTPIFAILFTPFTLLSHDTAKWAWNGLQVVFLVVAL
ncbi:MAG: hypothetical protein HY329_21210, partial [Chloroflexi bacterium]|nr:hypothetical protein [Chloroflexota bacterium]